VPKTRVVIELSPSRLQATLVRGRDAARTLYERIRIPDYAETWPAALDALQPRLAAMIKDLGVRKPEATLIYSSPTATAGVFSCPERAGGTRARAAARLALAESADLALDASPHALDYLSTDRRAADGQAAHIHTLGIADSETTSQALAEWLVRAGTSPAVLIPADVPGLVTAVDTALAQAGEDQVAVVLFVGEHSSVLTAASAGRLRFVRQIGIGTASLVDALAREIRPAGQERPPVTLDPATAAALLLSHGIPVRDQEVDQGRGLTGDSVLPLLQPILQRCIVEIKQSLRFGLDERERGRVRLFGSGPGSSIPRLVEVIGAQAGMQVEAAEPGPRVLSDELCGATSTWLAMRPLALNALPRGLDRQLSARRLIRATWAGVGVGCALLAVDAYRTHQLSDAAQRSVAELRARLAAAAQATSIQNNLVAASAALAAARERVAARLNGGTRWDAALAVMADRTPPSIRLQQIQMFSEGAKPVCRIIGHAPLADAADTSAPLKAYLDALSSSPIISSCRLGATQRATGPDGPIQNFEMTLWLVELAPRNTDLGECFSSAEPERGGTP
jgi:Tfp pilus assembly protein PilN